MSKPVEVGSLKIGQYVLIDGEPCRIVEFEKSKPGKHGSAKARIVAISAFTGQKKNLISPVDGKAEVPLIDKRTGQVLSISGNLLQVMDMENYQTFETPMPDDEDLRNRWLRESRSSTGPLWDGTWSSAERAELLISSKVPSKVRHLRLWPGMSVDALVEEMGATGVLGGGRIGAAADVIEDMFRGTDFMNF